MSPVLGAFEVGRRNFRKLINEPAQAKPSKSMFEKGMAFSSLFRGGVAAPTADGEGRGSYGHQQGPFMKIDQFPGLNRKKVVPVKKLHAHRRTSG
jgi:hypothetical protein